MRRSLATVGLISATFILLAIAAGADDVPAQPYALHPEVAFWVGVVRDIGFPIVVTGFLLLRMERTIGKMTSAIQELVNVVRREMR